MESAAITFMPAIPTRVLQQDGLGVVSNATGARPYRPRNRVQQITVLESNSYHLPGCYDPSWAPSEVRAEGLEYMGRILPLFAGLGPALLEGPCRTLTEGPSLRPLKSSHFPPVPEG